LDYRRSAEEEYRVALDDRQREFLIHGVGEWGGSAAMTPAVASFLGVGGVEDVSIWAARVIEAISAGKPLARKDWRRVLLASELSFASESWAPGSSGVWSLVSMMARALRCFGNSSGSL
jgi:hypothetical protein